MSEFGSGRTRVVRRPIPEGSTTEVIPEFAGGEVGQITHTRYIRGPAGEPPADESVILEYDLDGKLVTLTRVSGVTTLAYDVDNRLTTVIGPEQTKTLSYDLDDRLESVTIS